MAKRKFKRVVVLADLHCGCVVGLTPPQWQSNPATESKKAQIQSELWKFYSETIDSLKPIDRLINLGDSIDGTGHRSGGTEQLTTDRVKQTDMAAYCINYAKAKKVLMVYGTPYHTGDGEDWEDVVAGKVKNLAKIGSHEWPVVNGVTFDVKHKIGSSSIDHGRMTALAKAKAWNNIWHAEMEGQPKADILLRGHVHYHKFCGGDGWIAMTAPALQGYGSKYGARQCEGKVDIGLLVFDITEEGEYGWKPMFARLPQQKAQALEF